MIDLRLGDCIDILKTLPDNSVDSVVTDAPYGLSFMGKKWDYDVPSVEIWEECLRVLKPGGHLLSFGGSRTYHRMAVAIEDAGFEVRDQIMWIYGQGFPKSHNIGKAIDKIQGNEREVVGEMRAGQTAMGQNSGWNKHENKTEIEITKGQSDYEGWGTALKPAHEPICMARKPLSEKSIAENVLKHGTGGINIDGSRIGFRDEVDKESAKPGSLNATGEHSMFGLKSGNELNETGRFPSNIIFDEEAGKLLDEQSGKSKTRADKNYKHSNTNSDSEIFNGRGTYTPRQDEGGASRFFYCPKVSKKERNAGLDDMEEKESVLPGRNTFDENGNRLRADGSIIPPLVSKNHHPTVKPIALMEYLIKLVTPKGGVVLEPFMGSGSTGIAAKNLGMSFIGIEREQEYFDIAKQRIGE